jgi:hypothetical protein
VAVTYLHIHFDGAYLLSSSRILETVFVQLLALKPWDRSTTGMTMDHDGRLPKPYLAGKCTVEEVLQLQEDSLNNSAREFTAHSTQIFYSLTSAAWILAIFV